MKTTISDLLSRDRRLASDARPAPPPCLDPPDSITRASPGCARDGLQTSSSTHSFSAEHSPQPSRKVPISRAQGGIEAAVLLVDAPIGCDAVWVGLH